MSEYFAGTDDSGFSRDIDDFRPLIRARWPDTEITQPNLASILRGQLDDTDPTHLVWHSDPPRNFVECTINHQGQFVTIGSPNLEDVFPVVHWYRHVVPAKYAVYVYHDGPPHPVFTADMTLDDVYVTLRGGLRDGPQCFMVQPWAMTAGRPEPLSAMVASIHDLWPEATVRHLHVPPGPYCLRWEWLSSYGITLARLDAYLASVEVYGPVEEAARVAVWFRRWVPAQTPLAFWHYWHLYRDYPARIYRVPVTATTTVEDIVRVYGPLQITASPSDFGRDWT